MDILSAVTTLLPTLLRTGIVLALVTVVSTASVLAQHTPHDTDPPAQHRPPAESGPELFAAREASGTSWLPDETPMFGVHRVWGDWSVMLHGKAFAQFLYEPGDRHRTGGSSNQQFGSVNWGMAMARRRLGVGRFGLRAMVSLEPWTVPGCGYLSFLATGEVCEGDTIHDRQHPHDAFMEIAAEYDRPLRGDVRWQIYGGLAGEPALGPAGFPHRASALLNPIAPIAHHSLDSTHITFGLITAGAYGRRWKADMSLFNGREPDEHRVDLDLAPLDSFSGRLTLMPTSQVAIQISAGHLHEAEAEFAPQPRPSVDRMTASATYHRELPGEGLWATTLAYGANSSREVVVLDVLDAVTHAVMLESTLTLQNRESWFGRAEIVQKPAHDLHAHEFPLGIFTVGKMQVGYVRRLRSWKGLAPGIGGTVSFSFVPQELASRYGGRAVPGFGVFVTLLPARHPM